MQVEDPPGNTFQMTTKGIVSRMKSGWKGLPFWVKIIIVSSILALLGVILGLILGSRKRVDEGELCLKYDVHSRKVETEVYDTAGAHWIGVSGDFLCFPKAIQNMEFSYSDSATDEPLAARTKDGLDISLEISIEYRLIPSEIYTLFTEIAKNYGALFRRLARSSLRNSASKYSALEYLSPERLNISKAMQEDLNRVFRARHAESLSVQLRSIILDEEYDDAIKAVEAQQIDAKKAEQEQQVAITQQRSANETAVLDALSNREQVLIEARSDLSRTQLQRESVRAEEEIRRQSLLLQAETNRQNSLLQAESEITRVTSQRNAILTTAETLRKQKVISFETEIQRATADSQVSIIRAQAEADKIRQSGEAEANGIRALLEKGRENLRNLVTNGMSPTEVLQYLFIEALKTHKDTTFFVDYKKTSLFLENGNVETVSIMGTNNQSLF